MFGQAFLFRVKTNKWQSSRFIHIYALLFSNDFGFVWFNLQDVVNQNVILVMKFENENRKVNQLIFALSLIFNDLI